MNCVLLLFNKLLDTHGFPFNIFVNNQRTPPITFSTFLWLHYDSLIYRSSGHMLGGAIWKITKDDIEIVYAVDYNHKKELHLNGAMFEHIQRPHLLITSSYGSFQKVILVTG